LKTGGNRVWRQSTVDGVPTGRKYIVDISGELPVILCEIDTSTSSLKTSYIYADGQILSQRIHDAEDPNYFTLYYYVHDRLGSVRLMIDDTGTAVNSYTYKPYGSFYESEAIETIANPWKFTGQYYDAEIEQYYLRARQYDPTMMRFTSRDSDRGEVLESLTLHKYLYTVNNPINRTDPSGEIYLNVANGLKAATTVYAAGTLIAAYGAETGNFDLIIAGAFVQTLSPMAYMLGMGGGDKLVQVTRWGNPGTGKGWVMAGGKNPLNYLLSGKWQPGFGNQFAAYSTGHTFEVMASELSFPSGWKWVLGFFGQCMYAP
jgi:RHS repeat-associated protein